MTTHNVKMPCTKQNHVEGGIPRVYVCVRVYMTRLYVYMSDIVRRT